MPTFSPAVTHAQTYGTLGRSFDYLPDAIEVELAERFNVIDAGLVQLFGDMAGRGSDTLRVRRVGGLGGARAMTAMASETEVGSALGFTGGYTTVTIGRYHTGDTTSQMREILQQDGYGIEALAATYADSLIKSMRASMCTTGATMATAKGTSGAALDVDDLIGLIAAYEETEGFDGQVVDVTLHPEQWSDLRNATRSEPSLQFPDTWKELQTLRAQFGFKAALSGFNFWTSSDVTTSGGDHVGFSCVRGGIGYAIGSTDRLQMLNNGNRIVVPGAGLVIDYSTDGQRAIERADGNAYFGTALGSSAVYPQFKVLSVND